MIIQLNVGDSINKHLKPFIPSDDYTENLGAKENNTVKMFIFFKWIY